MFGYKHVKETLWLTVWAVLETYGLHIETEFWTSNETLSADAFKTLKYVFKFVQGKLEEIDVEKAVEFVVSCMNFDGGFGSRPGSESHAGLIYCCLGMLSVTGIIH